MARLTPPDPQDESRLQALFDRSVVELSGPERTRLAARAAEIPSQTRARWLGSWMVWAGASTAAAALLLGVLRLSPPAPSTSPPIASFAQPSETSRPMRPLTRPERRPAGFATTSLASVELLPDEDPVLGGLDGPANDADLDAWLAATEQILSDG